MHNCTLSSGNLAEEQRALATLGRTFYLHSHTELEAKQSKERVTTLLLSAGEHYLRSLEVCDKLVGNLPDRELLEMRSRLYLNLGLVYEDQRDLQSAKRFTEKALGVVEYVMLLHEYVMLLHGYNSLGHTT